MKAIKKLKGKELKRIKFLIIREKILKERQSSIRAWRNYEIGKKREQIITVTLQKMKAKGLIRDFLPTGDLSFQDVKEGIDFFVIWIDDAKYRICPLSITGKEWVEKHRYQHPEVPIIDVKEDDTVASLESKIIKVIRK